MPWGREAVSVHKCVVTRLFENTILRCEEAQETGDHVSHELGYLHGGFPRTSTFTTGSMLVHTSHLRAQCPKLCGTVNRTQQRHDRRASMVCMNIQINYIIYCQMVVFHRRKERAANPSSTCLFIAHACFSVRV